MKIASFTVDHNRLKRGIYVSRIDPVGESCVTTFDVRLKRPNAEPPMDVPAIHTLEHLLATYMRNISTLKDDVVYVGPMGCRTGFYFIFKGECTSAYIAPFIKEAFEYVASYEGEIPGATEPECGNYLDHNLVNAKWEAKKYLEEVLLNLDESRLNYPD